MLNSLRPLLEGLGNLLLPRVGENAQGPLRYGAPVGTPAAALKLSLTPFRHVGANGLVAFFSFFSAFFSFIVLAGFFFSCFF